MSIQKTLNIIGAGNLGKSIARLLVDYNQVQVLGICNQSLISASNAVAFIRQGQACASIKMLPPADITLIATPDDYICEISLNLTKSQKLFPGNIIFHCSGVLTSEVLSSAKLRDANIASIHPMKSFAKPQLAITNYAGTFCAMEGDDHALHILEPLFRSIGSVTHMVDKSKKATYHAAGVFGSNYLVTLFQQAVNCLTYSGVEEILALKIILQLMEGTLANIKNAMSPEASLSGPINRGDLETIKLHLKSLPSSQLQQLYSILGKATLQLSGHDPNLLGIIDKILSASEDA
jgi:predicted short-subunit dehydrogenase-like oxidoreductase (DUF2520 family)